MATVKITKRVMKRRQRNGTIKELLRYVVNYRDPKTGEREQRFFDKQKEAQAFQSQTIADMRDGVYADRRDVPTIAEAFDNWVNDRRGHVKPRTIEGYEGHRPYIVGPLLSGTAVHRMEYGRTEKVPQGCKLLDMLGDKKVIDLTTADIRAWHRTVADTVGLHSANRAQQYLKTLMSIAAEDNNLRLAPMPRRIGRGKPKAKKAILAPEQVKMLLAMAEKDTDYGIYYAFPFMTGVRPSEQLGLLWDDVDLEKRVIHICRMQEKNGTLSDITKTAAGTRLIPISDMLYRMLTDWKEHCPRREGQPYRVFPNIGFYRFNDEPRNGGGYCLLYTNFRRRVWNVALKKAGLPHVTPHSARHFFISVLQMQGVEPGLVAKLAGHANATITLTHYTQAVRGGEEAIEAFSKIFQTPAANPVPPQIAA